MRTAKIASVIAVTLLVGAGLWASASTADARECGSSSTGFEYRDSTVTDIYVLASDHNLRNRDTNEFANWQKIGSVDGDGGTTFERADVDVDLNPMALGSRVDTEHDEVPDTNVNFNHRYKTTQWQTTQWFDHSYLETSHISFYKHTYVIQILHETSTTLPPCPKVVITTTTTTPPPTTTTTTPPPMTTTTPPPMTTTQPPEPETESGSMIYTCPVWDYTYTRVSNHHPLVETKVRRPDLDYQSLDPCG